VIAVIANPTSGRGKGGKLVPRVDALLRSMGVEHVLHVSKNAEEPEVLARRAAEEGADIVAALGGDGHVGAVANGLYGTSAVLAVIPAGTGNDFCRHLGLDRKDPLAAVRLLQDPVTRALDVVRVHTPERERIYVNVGGAGFDSDVNELANRMRRLKGTLKYVAATFVTLGRFHAGEFVVAVDGVEHRFKGMMLAVGNGSSYGGGMLICPDAKSNDGILDVCVITEVGKPTFVKTFPKVFKGRHVDHPAVRMFSGREVRISSDRPFRVYADGEAVGSLPATFTVEPDALRVVVPR
jgi:diacylglycerol kinase (ATP)